MTRLKHTVKRFSENLALGGQFFEKDKLTFSRLIFYSAVTPSKKMDMQLPNTKHKN